MTKWLIIVTLVITNPYEDIDYNEINTYIIEESCFENCIGYTEPEITNEPEESKDELEVIQVHPFYRDLLRYNRNL